MDTPETAPLVTSWPGPGTLLELPADPRHLVVSTDQAALLHRLADDAESGMPGAAQELVAALRHILPLPSA